LETVDSVRTGLPNSLNAVTVTSLGTTLCVNVVSRQRRCQSTVFMPWYHHSMMMMMMMIREVMSARSYS